MVNIYDWRLRVLTTLSGVVLQTVVYSLNHAVAQSNIVPDETLGDERSQVVPLDTNGFAVDAISGGAVRGNNLFHSFQEFNVSAGREAYFLSPNTEIQNILARVTGNNRSEILGILGTFGNSPLNLFVINPNGIIFGEKASLNVSGSFVATTANGVQFGNLGIFSAINPEVPSSLLTVNPKALFFNQINQTASIQNNSIADAGKDLAGFDTIGLRVPDGKSLLLIGGNVSLNALGGRVDLGGLVEAGNINLLFDGDNLRLGFPENVTSMVCPTEVEIVPQAS
ncbi:filamentous hemagglutinin N-terminal domain-containing protein [Scytonema hofmannii]